MAISLIRIKTNHCSTNSNIEITSGLDNNGKILARRVRLVFNPGAYADRGSIDFPIVGVAFSFLPAEKDYRICFTAVDPQAHAGEEG